eukprot:scaffold171_cov263-Pinguiococcus_pyrenoidosus.AAC.9
MHLDSAAKGPWNPATVAPSSLQRSPQSSSLHHDKSTISAPQQDWALDSKAKSAIDGADASHEQDTLAEGDEENNEKQNDAASSESGGKQRKFRKSALPQASVEYLKAWMTNPGHVHHPYPSEAEKIEMVRVTGLDLKQINNWFTNNRRRYWKPWAKNQKKGFWTSQRGRRHAPFPSLSSPAFPSATSTTLPGAATAKPGTSFPVANNPAVAVRASDASVVIKLPLSSLLADKSVLQQRQLEEAVQQQQLRQHVTRDGTLHLPSPGAPDMSSGTAIDLNTKLGDAFRVALGLDLDASKELTMASSADLRQQGMLDLSELTRRPQAGTPSPTLGNLDREAYPAQTLTSLMFPKPPQVGVSFRLFVVISRSSALLLLLLLLLPTRCLSWEPPCQEKMGSTFQAVIETNDNRNLSLDAGAAVVILSLAASAASRGRERLRRAE